MKPLTAWLLVLLLVPAVASAQNTDPLPRHGMLGAAMELRDGAVTVKAIIPGSAAQRAALAAGDRVVAVDGTRVESLAQFLQLVHRPAGTTVTLAIERNGTPLTIAATLSAAPDERDPLVETLYRSVSVDGTLRRVLLTLPAGARHPLPALMIVGGIGCFSVDTGNPQDAYRNLSHDVSLRGFVTLRVEKSGVGDSQGQPCGRVDFNDEVHAYDVALQWLLHDSHVDASQVYLFGHSIGTTIVPRLALQHSIAGLVVAEAVGIDWFEYELINWRRQLDASGADAATVDARMQVKTRCTYRLEIADEDYAQILKDDPQCASILSVYPVPAAYMQQVAALNIAEPWTKLKIPVLAIYGDADIVTGEADHRRIVAIVNAHAPGSAALRVIPGMDHYLADTATKNYDRTLSQIVAEWLCRHAVCRG